MKRLRVLLSAVLVLTIFSLCIVQAFAAEVDSEIDPEENNDTLLLKEETIICNATIDDEFSDDTVLVVIKHEDSMKLDDYDIESFSELADLNNVYEFTYYEKEDIQESFEEKKSEYIIYSDSSFANDRIDGYNNEKGIDDSIARTSDEIEYEAKRYAEFEVKRENPKYHTILRLTLSTNEKQSVLDTIKELEKRDDVLSAEPDYITYSTAVPNDSEYNSQWAPNNMNLPSAWNITTGSTNVLVGVIDSGIQGNHPDLQANICSNTSYHKSYVDNSPLTDSNGHGTHVAGIIGAKGNNGIGVAGGCWNVSLVSFKVRQGSTGLTSNVVEAIQDAKILGIDILNYSGTSQSSNTLNTTLMTYHGLFVCSSGNDGENLNNNPQSQSCYPSLFSCTNIISVASIQQNNQLATDSNYGKTSVDLAAPGVGILSTINSYNNYGYKSGTSMAAPQVAGVAALIKSACPNISPMGIKRAILDNTTYCSSLDGKVVTDGKLNAYAALYSAIHSNNTYTIEYNKGTGSGSSMPPTTVSFGEAANLNHFSFYREGYVFVGWYAQNSSGQWEHLNADGTIEWKNPIESNIHLYHDCADDMDGISTLTRTNNDTITMVAQYRVSNYIVKYDQSLVTIPGQGQYELNAQYFTTYHLLNNINPSNKIDNRFIIINDYNVYCYHNGQKLWLCFNPYAQTDTWCSNTAGFEKTSFLRGEQYSKLIDIDGKEVWFYPNWLYRGDVDQDGVLSVLDAQMIQKHLAHIITIDDYMLPVADYNRDEVVDILDAHQIQQDLANGN